MGERHRELTLLPHPMATGLEIIAISGTRGEIRLRWNIIRDVSAAWTAHLKFNEISDLTCFFGFPPCLALRTPNSSELINIAPTEICPNLKQDKQQQDDEKAHTTKDEKRHFLKLAPSVKQRYWFNKGTDISSALRRCCNAACILQKLNSVQT